MYLIVGLGNPEKDYAKSRHNLGFDVINALAKKYEINLTRKKFNGYYGAGTIEDEKVILVKPQTFMNNSGECIRDFKKFYKLEDDDIIVIYDDIDVEPGRIRIRQKGSPGKHNGAKSVAYCLGTERFKRIRVGIGKPEKFENLIEYVIGELTEEELKPLEEGINVAVEAVGVIMKYGMIKAMNDYN